MPIPSRSTSSRSTSSRRAWSLSVSSPGRHARRRTAPRRAVTALGAVAAATAVPVLTAGAASAATAGDWQRLAMCESTGNWHINTGNGYYGGLQFSSSTWLAFGGGGYAPRADLASPEQQMAIANGVLAAQGWNAWPVCSRKVGLYGTPTTPPPPPPAPMVVGAIASHYYALGGGYSVLGAPTSYELGSIRGGRYNFFQAGAMYWTAARGAWEVHGAVRARWQALGSEHSWLGYPTSDEYRTPVRVGADSTFEGGMVYWSPATGAHELRGAILQAWKRQGWENGALGFPVTGERPTARPGAISRFEGGSIAWSLPTGAHATQGAIDARWRSLGADASRLGLPTSNEYSVPGGRRSDFQGGSIVWTVTGGAVVRPR